MATDRCLLAGVCVAFSAAGAYSLESKRVLKELDHDVVASETSRSASCAAVIRDLQEGKVKRLLKARHA